MSQCDEKRPACEQCVKRGSECTFEHPFLEYTVLTKASWQETQPTLHDTPASTVRGFHSALSALGHPGSALQTAEINLRQELMHHFVQHTVTSLSDKEEIKQLWENEVPKIAQQHGYVLDALLGMTALHRAHVNGREDAGKDIEIAMRYQTDAIRSFKTQFCELTPQNVDVFMVYSSITLLSALAYRVLKPGYWPVDCLEATVGIFTLLRDTARVIWMEYDWFTKGIFEPFSRLDEPDPSTISPEARSALQNLRSLSCVIASDDSVKEIYADTIWRLERSWMRASSHPLNSVFPVLVQEGYIVLLKERDPMALVILVHWAAFLHDFRHFWYIGNWGRELVRTISGRLDDGWLPHVQRAVRVVSSEN